MAKGRRYALSLEETMLQTIGEVPRELDKVSSEFTKGKMNLRGPGNRVMLLPGTHDALLEKLDCLVKEGDPSAKGDLYYGDTVIVYNRESQGMFRLQASLYMQHKTSVGQSQCALELCDIEVGYRVSYDKEYATSDPDEKGVKVVDTVEILTVEWRGNNILPNLTAAEVEELEDQIEMEENKELGNGQTLRRLRR